MRTAPRRRFRMAAILVLGAGFLGAFTGAAADEMDGGLAGERIRAHIEFLADDHLRGRQPGTPGYDIAANYVASQFRQLGLEPAGGDGDYLQPVPLRQAWQVPDSAEFHYERDGERRAFRFVEEYFIGASRAYEESEVRAPLVFAGYGIDAPPLGHTDYADLDAEGKVVVILAGQPADFPSEEGAHFSSGREKIRAAAAAGAVGMIQVYTPRSERRFAWDRLETLVGMPSMGWLDGDGAVFGAPLQLRGGAFLHYDAAAELFEGAPASLEEVLALDEAAEPLPAFPLPGEVFLSQRSRHEVISSPNVAALLPGSDPLLADETVVYTAHLDHIGVLPGDDHEDAINNGAMDNAAGIAVMLETARRFIEKGAPRRSVLFLAVTAEEKGLVGSEYFAHHPTVAPGSMVGVVNLDMPVLVYDFADVIAFGAGHSSLGAVVEAAAASEDTALTPDPWPEQNIFVRSDHYRFVQQGIPSVFLVTGVNTRDGASTGEGMTIADKFRQEHYHQPSDESSLPIDYAAAARFTRINHRIGELIANDPERPRWNEGDFFGETFSP